MKTTLHHCAYNITPNSLELVLELFEKMGCSLAYQEEDTTWCMIEQKSLPVKIQIIEVQQIPISDIHKKKSTHIGFLSETPEADILGLEKWAENKGIHSRNGSWSKRELWFDLPEIFVNFVVEIMHTSIVE